MNLCVLQGVVVGDPRIAELPSGETALTFDVQTEVDGKARPSVPVEWTGAASKLPKVSNDVSVAVTGTVARRFYRSGGAIQTRVYVRPSKIVLRQPKRQATAIKEALRGDGPE